MSYGRNENQVIEWLSCLTAYGLLGYAIWAWRGWRAILVALLIIIVGLLALKGILSWIAKLKENRRRREPCSHGIRGANYLKQMCSICVREEAEREAERQKQLEQRKLQEEEERQRRYREWLAQIRLPKFLKTVDPEEFEKLICRLFSQMGYRVEPTPYVGDNGSDGYIFKNGKKTVIQCKRVQGSVGEPVIRDLYGTMHATQCDDAIVVTTGKVSKQARAWIDGKPIRIIEIDELQGMLVRHFKESDIVPKSFTVSGWLDLCPRCGKNLRIVKGRWGKFIGCTGYPGCRFTRRHLEPKSPSKPAT